MKNRKVIELQNAYFHRVNMRSTQLMLKLIIAYFFIGIFFGLMFSNVTVSLIVGGAILLCYWVTKYFFASSIFSAYFLSTAIGLFSLQFLFQTNNFVNVDFFVVIGSIMLISSQNWKLQIPLIVILIIQHLFIYFVFSFGQMYNVHDFEKFLFSRNELLNDILLTAVFFMSGYRANSYRLTSIRFIDQSYELGRLQEKLNERTELLKVNQELDYFVYSVSHDLRAPLTGMLGVLLLAEKEVIEPKTKKYLQLLKDGVKRLDCFISDILDYSQNCRLDKHVEVVDFKKMLDDITYNLTGVIGKVEGLNIETYIHDEHTFKTDKVRLNMVLNNLISNAVRYRRSGDEPSFVKVNIVTNENGADIFVEDNGIGIKEKSQGKVFDMFYRGTSASVGSGLGLYVVKEALEKLNGKINVSSVLGKGTKFAIHLPTL